MEVSGLFFQSIYMFYLGILLYAMTGTRSRSEAVRRLRNGGASGDHLEGPRVRSEAQAVHRQAVGTPGATIAQELRRLDCQRWQRWRSMTSPPQTLQTVKDYFIFSSFFSDIKNSRR